MKCRFMTGLILTALVLAGCTNDTAVNNIKIKHAQEIGADGFPVPGARKYNIDMSNVSYFVSPSGDDSNNGKSPANAFLTMQKASDVVQPGETVLVMKGTYKEGFWINKHGRPDAWISFIAEPGTEIRGSDIEQNWKLEDAAKGIYGVERPLLVNPHGQKPDTPLNLRTEQVFMNGKILRQVSEREMLKPKNVFYVDDNNKKLLVCLEGKADPNTQNTEVSRRTWAIAIGSHPNRNYFTETAVAKECVASYIRVQGFTIRNIANFSRMAAIQIRGSIVTDIIVEDCDVQFANFIGISYAGNDHFSKTESKWQTFNLKDIVIRHCIASNNGVQGIGGSCADNVLLEYNIMDNNNFKGMSIWGEGGGFKGGFYCDNNVIRGNVVRNNDNHGLWTDNGGEGFIFENNFVSGNIAGAILGECTPANRRKHTADGKLEAIVPSPEEAKKDIRKGTIIRNNVLMNTRTPGGGGVNISNSSDAQVYNNIIFNNEGGGINIYVQNRTDGTGVRRNKAWGNVCDRNNYYLTMTKDGDDTYKCSFDNLISGNLFLKAKNPKPFGFGGPLTKEEFEEQNPKSKNVFSDEALFRNPENGDFTIIKPELAQKIGFDSSAMRLDWSKYFVPLKKKEANNRANLVFEPLDMGSNFNRSLKDDVAGDGKGGWSDQGPNDMSLIPSGKQVFDGITWLIGDPKAVNGAVMLATEKFKTEKPCPESITLDGGGRKYNQMYFLYTAAYCSPGKGADGQSVKDTEVARFLLNYADGTKVELPVILGKHIHDWWLDPSWEEHAQINDNKCYVAWQGANREIGKVSLFYREWENPNPEKAIQSIEVSKKSANTDAAFFLLGITGGTNKKNETAAGDRVFRIGFDKNLDAEGAFGEEIESSASKDAALSSKIAFVPGVAGSAYLSDFKMITYPVPEGINPESGTMSLWLKAEDWKTEKRIKEMKNADYRHSMTPFSTESKTQWALTFNISKDYREIHLTTYMGGVGIDAGDVSEMIKPDKWFNMSLTWRPCPDKAELTEMKIYLDGKAIKTITQGKKPGPWEGTLYIGCPSNGGTPWIGIMDEFEIHKKAFSGAEIVERVKLKAGSPFIN